MAMLRQEETFRQQVIVIRIKQSKAELADQPPNSRVRFSSRAPGSDP